MKKLAPLLPYFKPCRRSLIGGILCVAGTAALGLTAPIIIGRAIDAMATDITRQRLVLYGVLLVGLILAQGIFRYGQRMILVTMSRRIELNLRNDFFAHLEKLHMGFFQRSSTGDLMARATNDLNAVRLLCGPAIMYATNTVITGIAAVTLMSRVHGGLTLVAVCILPLTAIVTRVFGKRIHVLFNDVQEHFSTLSTQVQQNLSGARVVRAYAQEEAEEASFAEVSKEYVERNRQLTRWNAGFSPLLHLMVGLGFAAVLIYGGHLMIQGVITVGEFVTFDLFFGELVWPMIAIGWVINLTERGTASMARIQQVLDEEPEIRDHPSVRSPGIPLAGSIELRSLHFSYGVDQPEVLCDLHLSASAGETVAIVGRTGAGKSTLLALIPRLFEPPRGQIFVDGIDILDWPLKEMRGALAMVPQETFLFSASLRDNIAFGKPDASDDDIRHAAGLADLNADLSDFPQGLDTLVGERGITLSGGQKQRVALARALLCEPRILLLDDCLSAVDSQTEARILSNLRSVFKGRTVFFVTHRVSAAQTADQIIVLDDGKIIERGHHRDLLQDEGIYADLALRQQLEEELAAV